jgi:RNA polymerase sigma-70 factor (ECF subfamily)
MGMRGTTDDQLRALYDRTLSDVHRYASRLCGGDRARTEELVQETYLAMIRHARAHPTEELGVGWLMVTCRHRFIDDERSQQRRRHRETVVALDRSAVMDTPSDTGILGALATLPGMQRAALVLRYVDDLPVDEVARSIGKSVRATESLLVRARTALRGQVEQELTNGR